MKQYLTLDLGKNWMRWSITSESLDVIRHGKIKIESVSDREAVFQPICQMAEMYRGQVEGIALSMPGVIDSRYGIAYSGGVYSWIRNEPLALELEAATGMKTLLLNDAKAAALAELGYGSLKNVQEGVMLMLLGTGIGGAIIHHGKLLRGAHFGAGEFSYLTDSYERPGNNEDMFALSCSLDGLVDLVKQTTGKENMNILKIMFGLNRGDEGIKKGVELYCRRLANFIFNIQCVVDASVFVISGNITDEPAFVKMIQEAIDNRFANDVYGNIFQPEIKGVTFHEDSRKYGAVYEFKRYEEKGWAYSEL